MSSKALSDEELLRGARDIYRLDVTRERGRFVVQIENLRFAYQRREFDAFLEGYCQAAQKAWAEKYESEHYQDDDHEDCGS